MRRSPARGGRQLGVLQRPERTFRRSLARTTGMADLPSGNDPCAAEAGSVRSTTHERQVSVRKGALAVLGRCGIDQATAQPPLEVVVELLDIKKWLSPVFSVLLGQSRNLAWPIPSQDSSVCAEGDRDCEVEQ
jgi:hypothetical protein